MQGQILQSLVNIIIYSNTLNSLRKNMVKKESLISYSVISNVSNLDGFNTRQSFLHELNGFSEVNGL